MIVIGVDVGGTSLRVALYLHGTERGRAEGGGQPMRSGRGGILAARIAALARPLLARAGPLRADAMVIGAAGAGSQAEQDELERAIEQERLAWRVVVVSDVELARTAAFAGKPGILLIAGTGSIALALDSAGELHRSGGLGWRMGDQGSGYALGAAALIAIGRMHDGIGPVTRLTEGLAVEAGVAGVAALIRWSTTATTAEVAALAPKVIEIAERGDSVAVTIVSEGVDHLVALIESVGGATLPIALSGGLIAPDRPLRPWLERALKKRLGISTIERPVDPCRGAPILAEASVDR